MNRMVKEHKKHGRRVLCIFMAVIAAVSMLCFAGCWLKINRGKDGFGNYHRYCRRKVHFAAGDDRKNRKSISRRNE